MSGLVEKLETAEVGSRDLDYAIKHWLETNTDDAYWKLRVAADWTTSLDAALALAERALPGWTSWEIFSRRAKTRFVAEVARMSEGEPDEEIREYGHAPTPALALCIAICRALNLNETRHAE